MDAKKAGPSLSSNLSGLAAALDRLDSAKLLEEKSRGGRTNRLRSSLSLLHLVVQPSEDSPHSENALAVFAKPPIPGRVKTRLLGQLRPDEAAEVHLACILDTMLLACSVTHCRCCFFGAPTTNKEVFFKYPFWTPTSARWRVATQRGANLGARMANAFRELFREGAKKVVIIGTDSPWMGRKRILQAFRLLDGHDIVLGPAKDGGYYLVGAKRLVPPMFRKVDWGTSRVLLQTIRTLERDGVPHALLKPDFDLDRPSDLRRLRRMWRQPRGFPFHLRVLFHLWKQDALKESSRRRGRDLPHKKPRPGRG